MKNFLYQQRCTFSIRKLAIGACSVMIGAFLLSPGVVFAEQVSSGTAESNQPTVQVEPGATASADDHSEPSPSAALVSSETTENHGHVSSETETPSVAHSAEVRNETATVSPDRPSESEASTVSRPDVISVKPGESSRNTLPEPDRPTFEKKAGQIGRITQVTQSQEDQRIFDIRYESGQKGRLSFYNDHVVRYHIVEGDAEFLETPAPSRPDRPASMVVKALKDYEIKAPPTLLEDKDYFRFETSRLLLRLHKELSTMSILDKRTRKIVLNESEPLTITETSSSQNLKSDADAQYFGGGTQNGRFTHKGKTIKIVNENNWVNNGVASPNPFYWTTAGYGVLRHTFRPGQYDFESKQAATVTHTHQDKIFDAFYFINQKPTEILRDYYQLTGAPQVLPIFALYEGHLNAYNRDYWVEVPEGTRGGHLF